MKSPILVGGASRSGTTLVRVILDTHKNISCGPEFRVTPCFGLFYKKLINNPTAMEALGHTKEELAGSIAELLQVMWSPLMHHHNKVRIAEKTPLNCHQFDSLHEIFPDSPIIHVIRDGRDVVCSLLAQDWVDINTGEVVEHTQDVRKAAELWVDMVSSGLKARSLPNASDFYYELRYEDIVQSPKDTLVKLFQFIGEEWDDAVLNFHKVNRNLAGEPSANQVNQPLYQRSKGRWTTDLLGEDREIVREVCSELLVELGYAQDKNW